MTLYLFFIVPKHQLTEEDFEKNVYDKHSP